MRNTLYLRQKFLALYLVSEYKDVVSMLRSSRESSVSSAGCSLMFNWLKPRVFAKWLYPAAYIDYLQPIRYKCALSQKPPSEYQTISTPYYAQGAFNFTCSQGRARLVKTRGKSVHLYAFWLRRNPHCYICQLYKFPGRAFNFCHV